MKYPGKHLTVTFEKKYRVAPKTSTPQHTPPLKRSKRKEEKNPGANNRRNKEKVRAQKHHQRYFEKNMDERFQSGSLCRRRLSMDIFNEKKKRESNDHCLNKKQTAPVPLSFGSSVRLQDLGLDTVTASPSSRTRHHLYGCDSLSW
jgi:hypothetical protein